METLDQQIKFFCQACLMEKPASENSPDPRYCQGCYDFLLKEAEMDTRRGNRDDWKPVNPCYKAKNGGEKTAQVSTGIRRIKSTLEGGNIKVDIIGATGASRATGKRGPKFRQLPEELIRKLAGKGMGSKAIATRLRKECEVTVSYKTIQRVLSGERKGSVEIEPC